MTEHQDDSLFQNDWLAAMCAHFQQALIDGDTDNADGLRILLHQLNVPAETIAGIESFAAAQRPPDPAPIHTSAFVDSATSASDDSLPDSSEPVMVFDQQATVDPPSEFDPVTETLEKVVPDEIAFVSAIMPADGSTAEIPSDISSDLNRGLSDEPVESRPREPDPLISTKAAKSGKKSRPGKSQPSLF